MYSWLLACKIRRYACIHACMQAEKLVGRQACMYDPIPTCLHAAYMHNSPNQPPSRRSVCACKGTCMRIGQRPALAKGNRQNSMIVFKYQGCLWCFQSGRLSRAVDQCLAESSKSRVVKYKSTYAGLTIKVPLVCDSHS